MILCLQADTRWTNPLIYDACLPRAVSVPDPRLYGPISSKVPTSTMVDLGLQTCVSTEYGGRGERMGSIYSNCCRTS